MIGKFKVAVVVAAMTISATANATIATVFDGISAGVADFDSTVTGTGATVNFDIWSGLSSGASIDRGDYVITQNDGGIGGVTTYGSMSGQVIGINPAGGGSDPRTDPLDYFNSGITFTFDSAVNAVGFEVGDWATCCYNPVTELFISFDGGAPILVASANTSSDGLFPSQDTGFNVFEIFVAAFDDTGDFTQVSFWGNGIGEFLVAGGQLRYALIEQGSLPGVPVPAPLALMGIGLLGMAWRGRKRASC
ncbi:PEP-CTERM sorting domain-containing protein [Sedimenticola sp.]|uniref:PEP-CTERM sorting domain-containing protein n=1 Tax=Sedimenticola sp. TaxID=1940285 RepID=UPI003D0DEE1B